MWIETEIASWNGKARARRWVADAADKPSRVHAELAKHHMTLDTKRALASGGMNADQYNEGRAIAYARWLAQRDGVALDPAWQARCVWDGFYSAHRTITRKGWPRPHASYCHRVRAVKFGHARFEARYDKRNRYAGRVEVFDAMATISIPHWDFEPTPLAPDADAPATITEQAELCHV